MKTLVISGSPRKNGYTNKMVNSFLINSFGKVDIIDCYFDEILPCTDCRACHKNRMCTINDLMQEVYKKIDECDVIVFASPVYFHSISGKMKVVIDRFQLYWASFLRKDKNLDKQKKSVFLLCGGAKSFNNQFLGAELVLNSAANDINAANEFKIYIANTDKITEEEFLIQQKKIEELSLILYSSFK